MVIEPTSERTPPLSVPELLSLPISELESLWDNVPTEYQDSLKRRYTQILRAKGITDDAGELDLIQSYLERYETEGLIPAGDKWLKISPAARQDFLLDVPEREAETEIEQRSRPPVALIGALLLGAMLLILLFTRIVGGHKAEIVADVGTATPTATSTLIPTATVVPTATPLALVDADRYVSEGDRRSNRDFYPVVFRMVPPDAAPRVFVVQERQVETTEWQYEPNPDVVSWLSGMLVQPVLGIPYSEANLRLLQSLASGTDFILRMNTGAELTFRFDDLHRIARDDTALFAQTRPGIAVVLIGQTDRDGLPTPLRLVASGTYLAAQELETLEQNLPGRPVVAGTDAMLDGLRITVAGAERQTDQTDFANIRVTLRFEATTSNINLNAYQWYLEDDNALQYTARSRPFATRFDAGTHHIASIGFRVPGMVSNGSLVVVAPDGKTLSFRLDITPPQSPLTVAALNVQIRSIERDSRYIYLAARLYNPTTSVLHLSASDVWLVSGYVADPPGPQRQPPDFAPLTLAPDQAWDTVWRFDWNGSDPYAAFGIAGRHYTVTLIRD